MDPETSRAQAIEFLEQIETRHNQVLDELDQLNARVQKVLDEYLLSRKKPATAADTQESDSPPSESTSAASHQDGLRQAEPSREAA